MTDKYIDGMLVVFCKHCKKEVEPEVSDQTFSNGMVHVRADCPECGCYLKYLS